MAACDEGGKLVLGFLTVVDHPDHGLFGGYLLLNAAGRPLEFHCTAPIKPNRAQQILYGPTLASFLYGDQIGRTLLEKAKVAPVLVCTDRAAMLEVRQFVAVPVALVLSAEGKALDEPAQCPAAMPVGWKAAEVGKNRLVLPESSCGRPQGIAERLGPLRESFDLAEPFARIREAIGEAQQAVRPSPPRAA